MESLERTQCAVTGLNGLEHLYTFKNFPVFMGCTDQPAQADLRHDMTWAISRDSGIIQLRTLLPLDVLYSESHGAGAVGALWRQHHSAFAKFIAKVSPMAVFEIGGAHGILANEYRGFATIPWTILEPNPTPTEGCSAIFMKGFFDEKFEYSEEFDTLVHSHVFEHMYSSNEFMESLSKFVRRGKKVIFSVPNMRVMMERKYTNCLNFEHTVFLTEPYIEFLLTKHGFRVIAKEYFMEDHSIFYSTVRDATVAPAHLPPELYSANKKLYDDYIFYHQRLVADINDEVRKTSRPIFLFGAHVFSQYLLEMGLAESKIVCLLDNDPKKQGKRLSGSSLKVANPSILADMQNPVVILKAGVYNEEIKADIIKNINVSTIFFE